MIVPDVAPAPKMSDRRALRLAMMAYLLEQPKGFKPFGACFMLEDVVFFPVALPERTCEWSLDVQLGPLRLIVDSVSSPTPATTTRRAAAIPSRFSVVSPSGTLAGGAGVSVVERGVVGCVVSMVCFVCVPISGLIHVCLRAQQARRPRC